MSLPRFVLIAACLGLLACSIIETTYDVTVGTLKLGYQVTKFAGKTVYYVGKFTFTVVMAPLSWPLTNDDLETIDGLPPKEAIRLGRVKTSPYVINGKRYVPMSVEEARTYRETGLASWYGYETYHQEGGHMTANGEAFDPRGLSAAHKHLPLPTFVRVVNLENHREIIVRVNDRGPFVEGSDHRFERRRGQEARLLREGHGPCPGGGCRTRELIEIRLVIPKLSDSLAAWFCHTSLMPSQAVF